MKCVYTKCFTLFSLVIHKFVVIMLLYAFFIRRTPKLMRLAQKLRKSPRAITKLKCIQILVRINWVIERWKSDKHARHVRWFDSIANGCTKQKQTRTLYSFIPRTFLLLPVTNPLFRNIRKEEQLAAEEAKKLRTAQLRSDVVFPFSSVFFSNLLAITAEDIGNDNVGSL